MLLIIGWPTLQNVIWCPAIWIVIYMFINILLADIFYDGFLLIYPQIIKHKDGFQMAKVGIDTADFGGKHIK